MSSGIAVDVSEFQAAMREYLSVTSKDTATAINGKARDLAIKAAMNTPKSTLSKAAFRLQQRSRPLIAYRTALRHGRPFSRDQFEQVRDEMASRSLGKGFMRSAWVKAANKFKNTRDASRLKPPAVDRFTDSKATAQQAKVNALRALFDCSWDAGSDRDRSGKQAMVDNAIARAVSVVTADMRAYLAKKYEQQAKKNSAAFARAVGKAFA